MKPLSRDTEPAVEAMLIEGYRRMSATEKLQRVGEMTQMVQALAMVDIRRRYPNATPREQQLRLAARWIDPELMRKAFGWDSEQEGY